MSQAPSNENAWWLEFGEQSRWILPLEFSYWKELLCSCTAIFRCRVSCSPRASQHNKNSYCHTSAMIWWPNEVPTLHYGLITLRKPEEQDILPLFEGVQDPIIPKFTRIPANYKMETAEHYVRERCPNGFTMRTELQLVLEYDGKFAGALSFHTLDLEDEKAEIGYWLTADVRGKGVATATTRLLTEYGFETIGFHRIEALVVASNIPSLKVLKNAGYMQEGIMKEASLQSDGSREDMVLFAAIRSDWGK